MAHGPTLLPPLLLALLLSGAVADTPTLRRNSSCPATTVVGGRAWPTRSYAKGCVIGPVENPALGSNVTDINIAVLSPFSGAVADVTTMAEPLMRFVVQEVEDAGYIPGFRLKLHLWDSLCNTQDATAQTIKALTTPPVKHALYGDTCTASCLAQNDVVQVYNLLQISPNCAATTLSDRDRYPNFVRTAPSVRWNVEAMLSLVKQLGWTRIALIAENLAITLDMMSLFFLRTQQDVASGVYKWKVLFQATYSGAADAPTIGGKIQAFDAHIIILGLYQGPGSVLLCEAYNRGLAAPDRIWLVATGWWDLDFLLSSEAATAVAVKSYGGTPCTSAQMLKSVYSCLLLDRGGMLETEDRHGLSGRTFRDIKTQYYAECKAFAGGLGLCSEFWSGYFYDALWEWAWLLRQYLVDEGRSLDQLATPASREWLFQKALTADFAGLTGRVRHFNKVSPTTSPASIGDRDGAITVRQITGLTDQPVRAQWTRSSSFLWSADLVWSQLDASVRLPCLGAGCNVSTGWIPADRNSTCPAGTVYSVDLGCQACPVGTAAAVGAAICEVCDAGRFNNLKGQTSCSPCRAGFYNKELGASRCIECLEGSFAALEASVRCELCARGGFANTTRATSCVPCHAGLSTLEAGSLSASACVCAEGFFLGEGGDCVVCPMGTECQAGARFPSVLPGFWTSNEAPLSVFRCIPEDRCPGGAPGTCGPLLEGQVCARCTEGYYLIGSNCERCSTSETSTWTFPMIVVFVVPAVITVLYRLLYTPPSMWESWRSRCAGLAFACFDHYQVLALLGQANVVLPAGNSLGGMVKFWSWTKDLLSVFRMACTGMRDVRSLLLLKTLGPVGLFVMGEATFIGSWLVAKGFRQPWLKMEHDRLLGLIFSLIFTFFVGIISQSLTLLRCVDMPNGRHTLASDSAVLCYESDWWGMLGIAIVALLVYGLGFSALLAVVIFQAPKRFSQVGFQKRWTFLFMKFRPNVFWWSGPHLFRSIMLNVGFVVTSIGVLQLYWLFTVTVLYSFAVAVFKPYRHKLPNLVEAASSISIVYCCSVAALFTEGGRDLLHLSTAGIFVSFAPLAFTILFWCLVFYGCMRPSYSDSHYDTIHEAVKEFASMNPQDLAELFGKLSEWDKETVLDFSKLLRWEVLGTGTGRSRVTVTNCNTVLRTISSRSSSRERMSRRDLEQGRGVIEGPVTVIQGVVSC